MKIVVLGVRGLPGVQGGVETHAENLYERLSRLGCEVDVLVRSPFVPPTRKEFGAVRLRRLWSPKTPGFEALVHSVLGVFYAAALRPDVLHIHAVGPALVTPLARLLGMRVVVTHHGPDYDRDKWGRFARWILQMGERAGMRHADVSIVISRVISDMVLAKYGVATQLIPNGVPPAQLQSSADHVEKFGAAPGKYFLQVSRMVPEKRQLDLIAAYVAAKLPGWKLLLVGGLDKTSYSRNVQEAAAAAGVVLTDFQNGVALQQLYTHAGAFVLPSSHEGLPIALLEALSYGVPVLASDIPANLEIALEQHCYFPLGDTAALAQRLCAISRRTQSDAERAARRDLVARNYDWSIVAEQTLLAYRKALKL